MKLNATPRPHIAGLKYPILFRFRLVNFQLHPFGKMSIAYIIAYHNCISYHLANHDLAAWEKQHRTDLCAGLCRLNCQLGCIAGLTLIGSGDIAYTNFEALHTQLKIQLDSCTLQHRETIPPICHQWSLTRNVCRSYIHINVVNPIQCHQNHPRNHMEFWWLGFYPSAPRARRSGSRPFVQANIDRCELGSNIVQGVWKLGDGAAQHPERSSWGALKAGPFQ